MKKKLGALLRVVVSVGILAYLFHGIFKKEALDYFQTHNIDPGIRCSGVSGRRLFGAWGRRCCGRRFARSMRFG